MAQSYIKLTGRGAQTVITYHESLGKATRVIRRVVVRNPTEESLSIAFVENLKELRVERGRTGRLIDG